MHRYFLWFFILSLLLVVKVKAQTELDERAIVNFKKGLGFYAADSTIAINLKFRMQNLVGLTTVSGQDLNIHEVEARVKRLRLRFDGFMKNKDITYYMQLGFARYDQDWDNTQSPNIIRDAMVYYHFNEKFYMGFGQSKLPGNRQRVISSGAQQFIDRSPVNNNFSLDRDFGVFAYYSNEVGPVNINFKSAVSTGEGRVCTKTDEGFCYTGRLEILPLGEFSENGDYFEGDLFHEKTPKISLAGGFSFNDNAIKTMGQRGTELFQERDMYNKLFDFLFKYNGWAVSSEFISRNSDNPFTVNGNNDTAFVYEGWGVNTQLSYCFRNHYELALRYAFVKPSDRIKTLTPENNMCVLGVSKYLKKHLLKVQTNITYNNNYYFQQGVNKPLLKDKWLFQFQVEMGI